MKTRKLFILLAALLALAPATACRRERPEGMSTTAEKAEAQDPHEKAESESAEDGAVHEGEEHEGGEHEGEEHGSGGHGGQMEAELLRIAPEMLRDLKLTTARAEARQAKQTVSVLGELRVDEDAYAAVATPIPARIVAMRAEPGQSVRAGQVLAELQSVELGRAWAEQESAAARAELARRTLERKRGLAAERIVSLGELQRTEAEAAGAEADLRSARAALAAFGIPSSRSRSGGDPSRFSLSSPISGTVLARTALRGETADPATPLFRVAGLSRLG